MGEFTVVIDGDRLPNLGKSTEDTAKVQVQILGREFIKDAAADLVHFSHVSAKDPIAVSLPHTLTLYTDAAAGGGDSTSGLGYRISVATAYGSGGSVEINAKPDGSTHSYADLVSDWTGAPVPEDIAVRAENAAASADADRIAAQQAAADAQAVGDTNDTIMAGVDADTASAFRAQQDARARAQLGVNAVRDFGATGDGVADDTFKIQSAIDFVAGLGGGTVHLPAGTYLVSSVLTLADRVFLRGDSPQSTVIRLADAANTDLVHSADFATLTGTNATTHPSYLGLIDLRLDGNKANNPTGGAGAKLYARAVFVDRVVIHDCHGDGLYTEGPASGAGVSSWTNLPPGMVGWLTCAKNDGNGWTHKGHSDMQVGFYHAVINTGHGLHMETVAGITRSTMNADHLRISSNGVAVGSRGVNLVGSGTDLICAVGRFENNGGAGIYADTNTMIRVGECQVLQNCKVADNYQVSLNAAHRSGFGDLLVKEPYRAVTGGINVTNCTRIRLTATIDGTPDPSGPSAGVANTGYGLALIGSSVEGGKYDVDVRNHDGTGGAGVRTGDSTGIVRNRVRVSSLNCKTAWWCTNAGVGNLFDVTATVAAGQNVTGGGAAGNPGVGGDARVFGNDGTVQVYP